mmetsp:Transcript_24521/g.83846  ORF Transcript_24521/g.83846 Transcript_24521/m.83846 type:complete len:264 (-) Transcript_24521:2480-3271(-)
MPSCTPTSSTPAPQSVPWPRATPRTGPSCGGSAPRRRPNSRGTRASRATAAASSTCSRGRAGRTRSTRSQSALGRYKSSSEPKHPRPTRCPCSFTRARFGASRSARSMAPPWARTSGTARSSSARSCWSTARSSRHCGSSSSARAAASRAASWPPSAQASSAPTPRSYTPTPPSPSTHRRCAAAPRLRARRTWRRASRPTLGASTRRPRARLLTSSFVATASTPSRTGPRSSRRCWPAREARRRSTSAAPSAPQRTRPSRNSS